ncbi:MAG: hypothetical protein V3W41_11310 [Planctomycetota bacterium]
MPSHISQFPADSYLRVFHAPRRLIEAEQAKISKVMAAFLPTWVAHEVPITGDFEILHDQFIVVSANESITPLSGCSKDSLIGVIRALSAALDLDFVHGPPLCFRAGEEIRAVDRKTFGDLVKAGDVTGETVVFDSTIASVGPYLAGKFETKAADCWHAKAFRDLATSE